MEPKLEKAQKIMDYINKHPEEIELYEMRELVKMDIASAKRRDKEEGRKEEKIEIATKMKKEGVTIENIVKFTNLTPEKIEKL